MIAMCVCVIRWTLFVVVVWECVFSTLRRKHETIFNVFHFAHVECTMYNVQCVDIKYKKVQISHFLSKVLLSSLVADDRSKIDDRPFNSYWVSFILLSEYLLPPSKVCACAHGISKTKMFSRHFAVLSSPHQCAVWLWK